jgi:hypothetical protein
MSLRSKTKAPERILFTQQVVFGPRAVVPQGSVLELAPGSTWPRHVLEQIETGAIIRLTPEHALDPLRKVSVLSDEHFQDWSAPEPPPPPAPVFLTKPELLRGLRWSDDDWDRAQASPSFPQPVRQRIGSEGYGTITPLWAADDIKKWIDGVRALAASLAHAKL